MTAYAIAHLYNPKINEEVIEYLERIQATMDPFRGKFLVHRAELRVKEGEWPGTVIVLEFPDVTAAEGWYASPVYRKILHLRTDNIDGSTLIVEGVAPGYDPAVTAAKLRDLAAR